MSSQTTIHDSRRNFLSNGLKLAGLAMLLSPLKSAWGQTPHATTMDREALVKLVLNKKTKVVQISGDRYFSESPSIGSKNLEAVDINNWEAKLKAPVHFRKDRSGIILEALALRKLEGGINDKSLNAAINTISMAFTPVYKDKDGKMVNKFNFRLHELLIKAIALSDSIPAAAKWTRFQLATGKINYGLLGAGEKLPVRMNWMVSKAKFDLQVFHIIAHKENYISRLKQRVADNKF